MKNDRRLCDMHACCNCTRYLSSEAAAVLAEATLVRAVIATTICVAAVAVAGGVTMSCVGRQRRLKREVHTTRLGHKCLRACVNDVRAAMALYSKLQSLRHQFPDMKLETVWFALDGGRRSLRNAQAILEDASAIRLAAKPPFFPSMTEALERAEARYWTRVNELLPWLHWLILHEARDRANFAVAVNAVRDAFTGNVADLVPYAHLAVSTRWSDPRVQAWAVAEMVKQLPPEFLRAAYIPRPLSHRVRMALVLAKLRSLNSPPTFTCAV